MEQQDTNVIRFPVHRRGTLTDTLNGFASRAAAPSWNASRREQHVTLLVADIRGQDRLASRMGPPGAAAAVRHALSAAIGVLRSHGGQRISVGGGDSQPVLCAEFSHPGHALTALVAATDLRDTVSAVGGELEACIGVNSGSVVEATISAGPPIVYRAMSTVRMFAVRLQEFAGPGQVFVSASTCGAIHPALARFRSIGPVRTNAGGETADAFALEELLPAARMGERLTTARRAPGGA
jgi:class 3 adenylate cyclase